MRIEESVDAAIAPQAPLSTKEVPGSERLRLGRGLLAKPPVWSGPAVLALAFGLFRIDAHQVWADEAATWWAATLPLPDLVRLASHVDAVLVPYYLFMKVWIGLLGDSAIALRLPSALAMAASAGMVVLLGRRLFDVRIGVVAGLLFAVLPAVSYYAQEARPYAFTVAAALLATLLLIRAMDRPSAALWLGYAGAIVLLGYLQILALLLLAAHAGYAAAMWRVGEDRVARWWAAAAPVAAGLLLPMLVLGATQRSQIGWIGPRSVGSLVQLPAILFGSAAAAGLVIGLAILAARPDDRRMLLLGAWAVVPPLVLFLASYAIPVMLPRYVLYTLPAWCLLAASVIASSGGNRRLVLARVTIVLATLLALTAFDHRDLRQSVRGIEPDFAAAAAAIDAGLEPGDGIVYVLPSMARTVLAYYLPPERRPRDVFAAVAADRAGNFNPDECADLAACLGDTPRIWLVSQQVGASAEPLVGLGSSTAGLLRQQFDLVSVMQLRQVTLALLVRRPGT